MCTGVEITAAQALLGSAALTAAGTYMQSEAASDAADKQQSILAAAEEESQRLNRAGEDTIQKFAAETFDPTKRAEGYEQAAANREQSLAEALVSARPTDSSAAGGNVSSDYLTARDTSAQGSMSEAAKRAKLLARTGAGGLMGQREAMQGGQLASDLAGLGVKSARNTRYAQNDVAGVRSDSLAGGLLSGLGAAGMSYAGGKMGAAKGKT